MKRVTGHAHAGHYSGTPFDHIVLAHDERHLRRKVLTLQRGEQILIDLPDPIAFTHGDVLVLEDGRMAEIIAAEEVLYEVTPRNRQHLSELAWHLGNRHLPAQLEEDRIVILRDHVIKAMLEGLALFESARFGTPKPERLLQRILQVATHPNDLVLDSFLGSGTTAAVAHKMGRRWIGIEMGEHARTHCLPRLKKVVEGEQGGISEAVGWKA